MKTPKALSKKLARQWQDPAIRENRLLSQGGWPVKLSIGIPTSRNMTQNLQETKDHLNLWRDVSTGTVHWESIRYRSTADPVDIPVSWQLDKPTEWIAAIHSSEVTQTFNQLIKIISSTDPLFHSLLVGQLHLIANKPVDEVIKAASLALVLEQDSAAGAPLRTLSFEATDTKFLERNRILLTRLLEVRFGKFVGELGLENFLGAADEGGHWLLLVDMDGSLLPFDQIRVRDSELFEINIPGDYVLVIENERCVHHLPTIKNAVAVLGAGRNLNWMSATWFDQKRVAYWGDIDTWGLAMLAQARRLQPSLTALLMSKEIYHQYCEQCAVEEPTCAGDKPPPGLTKVERKLYLDLLTKTKGRLEQEFLDKPQVENTILAWSQAD